MGEDVSSEMLDGSVALLPEKAGLHKNHGAGAPAAIRWGRSPAAGT